MALVVSDTVLNVSELTEGWELALSAAGAWATPADVQGEWLPAIVPGTAAQALAAAGRWSLEQPTPLHDQDIWYRVRLDRGGPCTLCFAGLATIAEAWLEGAPLFRSESMYVPVEAAVDFDGPAWLHIAFRSLNAALAQMRGRRARWRPQMIPEQRLRLVRTTLLGHMPGWCPPVHCVGPFRPVETVRSDGAPQLREADVRTSYRSGTGRVTATLAFESAPGLPEEALLCCAGQSAPLRRETVGDRTSFSGELLLEGVAPWWPHTHGAPALHGVRARLGERKIGLGRVGFREIAVDRGADGNGFGLIVNGVPVFCRGACWTPADIVSLTGDPKLLRRELEALCRAGMNMVRVGGTMAYEAQGFHDLCDAFGILVWQDFMFANFDYPADDPAFAALVRAEADALLDRLQCSPSLAVLCGGSEVAQQAAMLGLPRESWSNAIFDTILPAAVGARRPDVAYVPSSPSGGSLPFSADAGVTHYYGVGAYRRPLDDARRARVRFASECLALANVPDETTLATHLPLPAVNHPTWKARVPRDLGASWDFEDVRDHYLHDLYGLDPATLRSEDPARYLQLARAAPAEVMETAIGEWRRPGSPAAGALVWFWKDFLPGAGWGVMDALGEPKSVYYALKHACRPVQLLLSDEGVNGLAVHAINETAADLDITISLACLRDGRIPVATGKRHVRLPARGHISIAATDLFGGFFDATYAYRFGPAAHEVTVGRLSSGDGETIAEAFHWLRGRRVERHNLGLTCHVERQEGGWVLRIAAERAAAGLHVADENFTPDDDWFDLAPGAERIVRLTPRAAAPEGASPEGAIHALNATQPLRYSGV